MDMAAITGYEEALEKVKDDHSRADNDLRNTEGKIGELTNKLIDMGDDTREYTETVKTISELTIKREVLQAKAAKLQKAIASLHKIPAVSIVNGRIPKLIMLNDIETDIIIR